MIIETAEGRITTESVSTGAIRRPLLNAMVTRVIAGATMTVLVKGRKASAFRFSDLG